VNVFLDAEFNGFGGDLISMALVCEDGRTWYEVKQIPEALNAWVAENVIPVLGKKSIGSNAFKSSLHSFLRLLNGCEIIADWPTDLAHFFQELMGSDHSEALQFNCTARLDSSLVSVSDTPHNALADATGLAVANADRKAT
jgi:hypothetical protein